MNHSGQQRICFFTGPTLSAGDVRRASAKLDADVAVLPPIQQGDLLRMINDLPDVIGIIDGYFHQVPSVQHKEILLALENGARVLGAASLGALRAVELDIFGMEGIGEVYQLYKDGRIDGDDEVAVLHTGPEDDFRRLTEPLVNIRHQLRRARRCHVITPRTARLLSSVARRMHYSERSYEAVLLSAGKYCSDRAQLGAFREFVLHEPSDLKREDASTLVQAVIARVRGEEPWPAPRTIQIQRTKYFRILERDYIGYATGGRHVPASVALSFDRILSPEFPDLFRRVALRCLAVDEALERGLDTCDGDKLVSDFRRSERLQANSEFLAWLNSHCLSQHELIAGIRERELERRMLTVYRTIHPELGSDMTLYRALTDDVAARFGVTTEELTMPPFMQPGILWEEPLVRELKMNGSFRSALDRAARILDFEARLFHDDQELKHCFDSLLFHARETVEKWIAQRWNIGTERLGEALAARGIVRYREFLEIARRAYVYATHEPGALD
jgi:hypothetical protein